MVIDLNFQQCLRGNRKTKRKIFLNVLVYNCQFFKGMFVFSKNGVHLKNFKRTFFFKRHFDLHTMHIFPLN